MITKVCGLLGIEKIRALKSLKFDWVGLVFKHRTSLCQIALEHLPQHAKRFGVFADAEIDLILDCVMHYQLDGVQLDGHETPGYCQVLQDCLVNAHRTVLLMKKFRISRAEDFTQTYGFERYCHCFLFSLLSKDWEKMLFRYHGDTPFLLDSSLSTGGWQRWTECRHSGWIGVNVEIPDQE